jgi:outer membrane lipoprotein-sorting protein
MNRMTFRSLASAAALAALGVSAPALLTAPAAAQANGDLAKAVEALRGISTMQANFTQAGRDGARVTGVMTLKRPGRIRFQYQKEAKLLIVSDGKALTLIDYEVRQVQRWPISNSPLGALLDPKRDVMKYGKLQPTGDANVISVEVRDTSHPEYGVITMVFQKRASAPGGLELTSWVALDSQNQRTTVRLSGHRYGIAVPDSTFKYNDPRQQGPRK